MRSPSATSLAAKGAWLTQITPQGHHRRMRHAERCTETSRKTAAGWRRRFFTWSALLLMAVNVLGGALLPASQAVAATTAADALLGGKYIVVCTAAGMMAIAPKGEAPPVSAAAQGALCAFCLPLMHGAAAIPMVATASPPSAVEHLTAQTSPTNTLPFLAVRGIASPRAPPMV